jgi:excisionase family DNA binding protein
MAGPTETYLTTAGAARRLQVSRRTVTRWCEGGLITDAWKTPGPRGRWRVPESQVRFILAGRPVRPVRHLCAHAKPSGGE